MSNAKVDSYILRELYEIPPLESVSWWPQTVGWQFVAALLVVAFVYLCIRRGALWWKNRYRKEAQLALQRGSNLPYPQQPAELQRILTVVAQFVYGNRVPKQLGQPWLDFLQCHGGQFDLTQAEQWQQALLLPQGQWQLDEGAMQSLFTQAQQWLQHHPEANDV